MLLTLTYGNVQKLKAALESVQLPSALAKVDRFD